MKTKSLIFKITLLLLALALGKTELAAQCNDNGNLWNDSWVSCTKSLNPNPANGETHWLLYQFQEARHFSNCQIWNANREGESGQGIKEVFIEYSTGGNTWIELGVFTFDQAPETDDYTGFTGPDLPDFPIKSILFTVLSTYQDNGCAALAEVQFNVDPMECYNCDIDTTAYEIDETKVVIFPNPTREWIHIKTDRELFFRAELFNLGGQILIVEESPSTISISHLNPGAYILRLRDRRTQKAISQLVIVTD